MRMISKSAFVFSLCALCVNSYAEQNKESLAEQCRTQAQTVSTIIENQQKLSCIDKLNDASAKLNAAASFILSDISELARELIDKAVSDLHYAQFNGCNQYIQISHSRLEVHQLRYLL